MHEREEPSHGEPPSPGPSRGPFDDPRDYLKRLEAIFRLAPLGIGIVDFDGHTVMSNDTLRTSLGYSDEEFAAVPWSSFTHPDDIEPNLKLFNKVAAGEIDHFSMEKRFIRKDGTILWADLQSSVVRDEEGQPDFLIGMVQDITERKRLEEDLRAAERRYRLLVERVPAVVYVAGIGGDGPWHYVSPQIETMLGFTAKEWMADPSLWLRQVHPDDRELVLTIEDHALDPRPEDDPNSVSYRMLHRDGSLRWVRDDAIVLADRDGSFAWHGVLVDVTREKVLEERLGHQAFHDPLTGLPNRVLFRRRVDEALTWMRETGGQVHVLFIDLDQFKTINDSFGHEYGDRVIATAAKRIERCVRGTDFAARLGGDEFALLLRGATDPATKVLGDRILDALRGSLMRLGDVTVTVGASIGIAGAAPDDTADTLLRNADLAMYQAKREGRGRHFAYQAALHDEVVLRFRIEEALHAAVAADEVALAYQPIVHMETGAVVGLEALARWDHPELGAVPPSQFIPVAEQTGLMWQLGRRFLEHACRDLGAWRARTGADAYVSVNVSPLQLDTRFSRLVSRVLAASALDPSALVIEVTEGVLLLESSRAVIRELRSAGVRVAIDDFGTGYSSLSYLGDLPVDLIKIDQVFLRRTPDTDAQTLLHAVTSLTASLGLTAICEGIETPEQFRNVVSTGCRYGQGYLLWRPGPVDDVPSVICLAEAATVPAGAGTGSRPEG